MQQGDVVDVQGRLEYRSWDGDGGEKRSTVETVIETLQTLAGQFITEDDRRGQPVLNDGLNRVTIGGNLTRDADHRYLPTGNSITRLTVAVGERYGSKPDDEKVCYFELQAWGELAETLSEGTKGRGIIGIGRLLNDSWEDKNGNKRYGIKIELQRAHFVTSGGRPIAAAQPIQVNTGGVQAALTVADEAFPPEEDLPF